MANSVIDETRKITVDSENNLANKSEEAQAGVTRGLQEKKQGSYVSLINVAKPMTFERSVLQGAANQTQVPPLPPKRTRENKSKPSTSVNKASETPATKASPSKQHAGTRNQRNSHTKSVAHKNGHPSPGAPQKTPKTTNKDLDSKKPRLANIIGGRKLR